MQRMFTYLIQQCVNPHPEMLLNTILGDFMIISNHLSQRFYKEWHHKYKEIKQGTILRIAQTLSNIRAYFQNMGKNVDEIKISEVKIVLSTPFAGQYTLADMQKWKKLNALKVHGTVDEICGCIPKR